MRIGWSKPRKSRRTRNLRYVMRNGTRTCEGEIEGDCEDEEICEDAEEVLERQGFCGVCCIVQLAEGVHLLKQGWLRVIRVFGVVYLCIYYLNSIMRFCKLWISNVIYRGRNIRYI